MNFYNFTTNNEHYTGLVAFDEDVVGAFAKDDEYSVLITAHEPPPLSEYKTMRVKPYYWGPKTIDNGDFVNSNHMIISQKVVDTMGDMLHRSGVLYPLHTHGFQGNYYLFYITNEIDCLDEERCTGSTRLSLYVSKLCSSEEHCTSSTSSRDENAKSAYGGKFSSLYTFFIDKTKVPENADIFCVPHYPHCTFVSDNFRQAVEKYQLTGVKLWREGTNYWDNKSYIILNKPKRSEYTLSKIDQQLFTAVEKSQIDKIKELVALGANINERKGEWTPLLLAAKKGNVGVMSLLFDLGIATDLIDDALVIATGENKHTDCVAYLLEHGANINARDEESRTALSHAVERKRLKTVQFLLEHGANMHYAQTVGDPLHIAVQSGNIKITKLLLEHGANPNLPVDTFCGNTVLESALIIGETKMLKILLDYGANPNQIADDTEKTPIMVAVYFAPSECVQILIEKGANVNATDVYGRTALMCVAGFDDDDNKIAIARLLIEHGANVNAVDKNGETALSFAKQSGNHRMVQLLKEYGAK